VGTYNCYPVGRDYEERFECKAFDANGNLRLHTWHKGRTSALMECEAWERRGYVPARGSLTPEGLRQP
jgi:hypothetical protein